MITKLVVSVAIAGAATVGVAVPAGADPSAFNVLSCGDCPQTVKKGGPSVADQMRRGIQAALPGYPGLSGPDAQ